MRAGRRTDYLGVMRPDGDLPTTLNLHSRLAEMRDAAIRRPHFRAIYAHALVVAHMEGHLVADDHPSWSRIETALRAGGDPDELLDLVRRELLRLRGSKLRPGPPA